MSNLNKGIFELTSYSNHIHIAGTEENDMEIVSIKGNTVLNDNHCTYKRFREGINSQLYFYTEDYFNKYIKIFPNRIIYDSKGEEHELIHFKHSNYGGLLNIIPTMVTNNDILYIKIKVNKNTLDASDVCSLKFLNIYWNLKTLEEGVYESSMNVKNTNANSWLTWSSNNPEFFELKTTNNAGEHKAFDFEILNISLQKTEEAQCDFDFQSLNVNNITVQENSLKKINEYILNDDDACRLNILNKKILTAQELFM